MRFRQLDRIVQLKPGAEITAERTLVGHDRFFQDHFPEFRVFPGVLTLEAMFQACDWLLRATDEFRRSMVLLKEVRGLKFAGFVRPGQTFVVTAGVKKLDDRSGQFATRATVDGRLVSSARLVLEQLNLEDRWPTRAPFDPYLRMRRREQFQTLDPQSSSGEPVASTCFRWMWLDRFTRFVRGSHAEAVKTVSLTDEPIDLYMPGFPVMPGSLILEGLAQAGGTLISELKGFEKSVVLGKVSKSTFHRQAKPGDVMTYLCEIEEVQPEGSIVRGTSRIAGELHVEAELSFAYLGDQLGGIELIPPADLLRILRIYGLYDVGETEDGRPLPVPQRLLDAETEFLASKGAPS